MTEKHKAIDPILDHLAQRRGFDFSGCHADMLERRIAGRLAATACKDLEEYLHCLQRDADELDRLIDAVTIKVSSFFRDPLTFELLAGRILPTIVREKAEVGDTSLRVWSAGCARGEEAYSVAILIHELLQELLEREGRSMNLHLFATDIDEKVLKDAWKAVYAPSSMDDMKYRLVNRYFTVQGASFRLIPQIRGMVYFSLYDMLDGKYGVPPESVFGDFDLVLCRNLLIYFNLEYQERIFGKLYHALAHGGRLVLGAAEAPPMRLRHQLDRVFDFSPVYRKR